MKINRTPNPLFSTVELDEHDRQILKLKIEIDELHWAVSCVSYNLDGKHKTPDIDRALSDMKMYYDTEEENVKRVDELFGYYVDALSECHVGDCICVACSCTKCQAETLLGIDTIKGLGKHPAHSINSAFGRDNKRTIDEAIEHLENYEARLVAPVGDELERWNRAGGWAQHVPRWTAESKKAAEWLKAYRLEYFPSNSGLLYGDGTPKMIGTTSKGTESSGPH